MVYIWIAAIIVFAAIEALTTQLVTIWFALGSIAALIAQALEASTFTQIVVFVSVSIIALAVTRPLVKKFTKKKLIPTNADRCIGSQAIVTEEINNIKGTGQVNVKGVIWTARSENDSIIGQGETVTIEKIDGVKLMVALCNAEKASAEK